MRIYPPEEWKILSHVVLTPNIHWNPSILDYTVFLLPAEDGHKLWLRIVTIIDDHGTKVAQDPGHIQFINSINDQ